MHRVSNATTGGKLPQEDEKSAETAALHAGTGHRARLRQRLLTGGAEALADYEVLEFLLFAANPRGDTKPLAKALLARFGSLPAVLNAEPSMDVAKCELDVLDAGQELIDKHPDVGAIVMECHDFAPYAAALRKKLNMPVYSVYSFLTWFHAGLEPIRLGINQITALNRAGPERHNCFTPGEVL